MRAASDAEILNEVYLAALCRETDRGRASGRGRPRREQDRDRRKAWEDVVWALINSKEFLLDGIEAPVGWARHRSTRVVGATTDPWEVRDMTVGCPEFRTTCRISRRRLLQAGSAGIAGLSLPALLRAEQRPGPPRAGQAHHLPAPVRRPVASRHVRHEARRAGRDSRRVPADRHRPAGPVRDASICRGSPR